MKTSKTITGGLTFLMLALGGCYSFNNIITIEKTDSTFDRQTKKINSTDLPAKNVADKAVQKCPLYQLPELPKTPELPYRQLAKINPNDAGAIDRIQRQHIEDLRMYILHIQVLLEKSHSEYIKNCQTSTNP